jgi:hypothetical protein
VGQVIDPVAWGNPLWDQSVQQFASDADRTAQFPAGQRKAGAVTWLDDVKRVDVWDGASWAPVPAFTASFLQAADPTEIQSPTPGLPVLSIAAALTLPAGSKWIVQGAMSATTTTIADHIRCELYNMDTAAAIALSRGVGAFNTTINTGVDVFTRPTLITAGAAAFRVQVGCAPNGGTIIRTVSLATSPTAWISAQRVG